MKCSHGGCQTEAVVTVTPAKWYAYEGWNPDGDERPACRNHMAVICEMSDAEGHLVERVPE
jgi:hypothetical protein